MHRPGPWSHNRSIARGSILDADPGSILKAD
jgi:hypothetical protein